MTKSKREIWSEIDRLGSQPGNGNAVEVWGKICNLYRQIWAPALKKTMHDWMKKEAIKFANQPKPKGKDKK